MDYLRAVDTPLSYTLQGIGFLIILAVIFDIFVSSKLGIYPRFFGVILGIGLVIASTSAPIAEWRKSVKAEVASVYAVELTDKQLAELKYPIGELPEGFGRYGSTVLTEKSGKSYSEETITLVRDDGKLLLVSAGDRELLPLDDEDR